MLTCFFVKAFFYIYHNDHNFWKNIIFIKSVYYKSFFLQLKTLQNKVNVKKSQ